MSFNWIEKHSTNCKNCGHLVDERECVPEDDGDICQDCYQIVRAIVVDVIEITHHSINLMTSPETGNSYWAVIGHGDDGFSQQIDSYDSLESAQKDYPEAWCKASETGILG